MNYSIRYFDTLDSTNTYAKELAKNGASEGTVIVANSQTCGRGRMGRSFFSPKDTGIYMSIILRPKVSAESSLLFTTAAACAVAKTAEKHTGAKAQIKWVNDVYQNGKKICGILTEGQINPDGNLDFAIVGIGINLKSPKGGFGELSSVATAMFSDDRYDKEEIIKDLLDVFFSYCENIEKKPHLDEYAAYSFLTGETVDVLRAGEVLYSAKVLGIDENFSLVIEHDGVTEHLSSGEVSVKAVADQTL